MDIKPVVAIPLERSISYSDDVFPWLVAVAQQGWKFLFLPYTRIDTARNRFGLHFLKTDATHLVMLDIDHRHPFDVVQKLVARVQEDPSRLVVAGLYFRRSQPYDPLMFRVDDTGVYAIVDWEPGELLQVDGLATGAIIIAREVFERLEFPWFRYVYAKEDEFPGEDTYFCNQCNAAGIKLWVDTGNQSEHLYPGRINEAVFRAYLERHPEKVTIREVVKNGSN